MLNSCSEISQSMNGGAGFPALHPRRRGNCHSSTWQTPTLGTRGTNDRRDRNALTHSSAPSTHICRAPVLPQAAVRAHREGGVCLRFLKGSRSSETLPASPLYHHLHPQRNSWSL